MEFSLNIKRQNIPKVELIEDLRRVAENLGNGSVSMSEYDTYGKFGTTTVRRRFGKWNKALESAGIEKIRNRNISDVDLFKNIELIWTQLGRQPSKRDMIKPLSKFSDAPYCRRFGTWNKALQSFIEFINDGYDESVKDLNMNSTETELLEDKVKHISNRTISDRMRFRILVRDGFTCCKCGRSPLKERGVELHVDHINPWSKGGESIEDNLETKCEICNLGKGNAFNV